MMAAVCAAAIFQLLRCRAEEIVTHVLRYLSAYLRSVQQGVAPVQSCPDSRIINFAHEGVHIGVGSFRPDQQWTSCRESPCDFVRAEEPRNRIRDRCR